MIRKHIDVIYCGSDYNWVGSPYKKFYKDSQLEFIDRNTIPISSSDIRREKYENWDYLPTFVRSTFVKKILVCGMESTGKSTLTRTLANLFCTNCVKEIGRDICQQCGSEEAMTPVDFEEIIVKHKSAIIDAARLANKLLFIDTDAITTYFYATFNKYSTNETFVADLNLIKNIVDKYDLVLFNDTNVPFVDDGLRIENRGDSRNNLSEYFKKLYNNIKCEKFIILSGTYAERLEQAKTEIEELIDL